MAGISRGLSFLREQNEKAAEAREERQKQQENRVKAPWKLWLSTGDVARYWYLVKDADADTAAPMIHSITIPGKNGKADWDKDVLCSRVSRDEPKENCELCMDDVKFLGHRLIALVYVETILHKTQKKPEWTVGKRADGTKVFVETPDPHVRLQIMKSKLSTQVLNRVAEAGTLFDRPFKLEKVGESTSTQEILIPDDKMEVPDYVLAAYDSKMSIDDVVQAEFGNFTFKKPATASGNGAYTPSADDGKEVDF